MNSHDPLAITTAIIGLMLGACGDPPQESDAAAVVATPAEPATTGPPAVTDRIADLERHIRSHQQTIEDLEAAVVMERSKLEENPEYDPSFLNEMIQEQQHHRIEIDEALERIKTLKPATE